MWRWPGSGVSVFAVLLVMSLATAAAETDSGTITVLGHEIDRTRVTIPPDWGAPLTKPLRIQVAYNDEDIVFRARFPADRPGIHHDYLVFEGGRWVRYGESPIGRQRLGLYEDRFTFHVSDGAVRGFANQGCWVACHADLRNPFMYAAPTADQVKANAYYRDVIRQTDTRKYVLESRRTDRWWDVRWDQITAADADRIAALKRAGVLLDQWHWRAVRGGPIGVADDMYVLDYRHGDAGTSAFATNWDADAAQPRFMFDPERAGYAALRFEDVVEGRVSLDQAYYLGPDTMTAFDPELPWQEGDAIPRVFSRAPAGSRGVIAARATWADGWWTVEMRRALDTGHPDDKAFQEFRVYDLAFAFFTDATGNRFHYVTFPIALGLGQPADLAAVRFSGDEPDWDRVAATDLVAFYPGQVSWQYLVSDAHPGAPAVRNDSVSCAACHTPSGLAKRAVGLELRSEWEGPRPWTWAGGLLAVLAVAAAGILLRRR
jgi:hypothetical protein